MNLYAVEEFGQPLVAFQLSPTSDTASQGRRAGLSPEASVPARACSRKPCGSIAINAAAVADRKCLADRSLAIARRPSARHTPLAHAVTDCAVSRRTLQAGRVVRIRSHRSADLDAAIPSTQPSPPSATAVESLRGTTRGLRAPRSPRTQPACASSQPPVPTRPTDAHMSSGAKASRPTSAHPRRSH